MKCAIFALLASVGIQAIFATPTCTLHELSTKFEGYGGFNMPTTKDGLDILCKKLQPMYVEMIEYAERCPSGTEVSDKLNFFKSSQEGFDKLCIAGSKLNTKYLENAECLTRFNMSRDGGDCVKIVGPDELNDKDDCGMFYMYNGCLGKLLHAKCGNDAVSVWRALAKPTTDQFQRSFCCSKDKPSSGFVNPGIQAIFATPTCTTEEISKKFEAYGEFVFPTTKDELHIYCKKLQPILLEVIEYTKRCPAGTEVHNKLDFFQNSKEVLDKLCTAGSKLNTKFLDNIKCIHSLWNTTDGAACAEVAQPDELNENEPCGMNYMFHGCFGKIVYDKCGKDAVSVWRAYLRPALDYFQKIQCCSQGKQSPDFVNPAMLYF